MNPICKLSSTLVSPANLFSIRSSVHLATKQQPRSYAPERLEQHAERYS
jgi:hypothetical protein